MRLASRQRHRSKVLRLRERVTAIALRTPTQNLLSARGSGQLKLDSDCQGQLQRAPRRRRRSPFGRRSSLRRNASHIPRTTAMLASDIALEYPRQRLAVRPCSPRTVRLLCLAFFTQVTVGGRRLTAVGVVMGQGEDSDTSVILAAVHPRACGANLWRGENRAACNARCFRPSRGLLLPPRSRERHGPGLHPTRQAVARGLRLRRDDRIAPSRAARRRCGRAAARRPTEWRRARAASSRRSGAARRSPGRGGWRACAARTSSDDGCAGATCDRADWRTAARSDARGRGAVLAEPAAGPSPCARGRSWSGRPRRFLTGSARSCRAARRFRERAGSRVVV
jgi:hypothetical protein